MTTVTATSTDSSGNTATKTFTVTVTDDEAPVITAPNVTAKTSDDGTGNCSTRVYFAPTANDNCDGPLSVASVPASGSVFYKGMTTVTAKATDSSGNTATKTFTVTVTDDEKPVISAPNVTAKTSDDGTGNCSTTVSFAPTATDNCDGTVSVTTVPASGASFSSGVTTVTAMATDSSGNTATKTFTVTVTDDEPPSITCPNPATVQCTATVSKSDAVVTDNCGANVAWSTNGVAVPSGVDSVTLPVGCHTVSWTATDAAGNSASCSQSVLVEANLDMTDNCDSLVFTSGPTVSTAPVSLAVHLVAPANQTPCVTLTSLQVRFEVWTTGLTPSKVQTVLSPVNSSGDAGTLLPNLATGCYEVRAYLLYGSCEVGLSDITGHLLQVDLGSTLQRVVGGGWTANAWSQNGKGSFGFVAGYSAKGKTTLTGNSVFMLHSVLATDTYYYDWKVKDTTWNNSTLTFYHNPAITTGTLADSARFTCQGVVQQINSQGKVVWSSGNMTVVVDAFDGDLYAPVRKDAYSIKVYDANNNLWWGSSSGLLPLANNGPGGGNVKLFK
jgi:hypothetical protein